VSLDTTARCDVLDSSVWIYAFTQRCDEAVALVESIRDGGLSVAMSPYIYEEVFVNLDRCLGSDRRDDILTAVAEFLSGTPNVRTPSVAETEAVDLTERRTAPEVELAAAALGVQPKDVPVVSFAHQQDGSTILYTSDRSLSTFDPADHDLDGLTVEYVDCEGTADDGDLSVVDD
jgi:predicted nucleic acid-binding protein